MVEWHKLEIDPGYEVSNTGKVRSFKKKSGGLYDEPHMRKPVEDQKGYLRVNLSVNGRMVNRKIHRLVAKYFVPNPENKPQVNHKDGDKGNNNYSNLQWVTNKENMAHAYATGIRNNIGENNGKAILTEEDVIEIRQLLDQGVYQKDIAEMFGVKQITISNINTGKNWSHI